MGVYVHLDALAAPERMLAHEEFTSLVLELAQDSTVTFPLTIASGVMTYEREDDLRNAHELTGADGYSLDDSTTTWYSGSDHAEIKGALQRLSYGQADICAGFHLYPTLYALTAPRLLAFTSSNSSDVQYLTAAHICMMGSRKLPAPFPTPFSYHYYEILDKYYGPLQLVYTHF